ncbi:MAG TPA: cytochrome d ubiquinol oxidase subunit II [Saprospiraceae bacterium]|nr:cytochrome d ubiquinol oxidase subunit II [Saprospiraceae bacterium]
MELFWYIALISMLVIYVILDGYDFGAGIIYLFLAKDEKDKKSILNAIGPFWDANEVWIIAGGGVLFFTFPKLYAAAFSGFYLPLIMILWLLIFRAIGIELRSQIDHKMWHGIWDKSFGIASLLLALFFGIALGNIVRGVNLGGVVDGVSSYEPHYFFLPLWNPSFSPHSETLGVIDWFTLLLGVIGVISLTIHGATWIILKTNSQLNQRLKRLIFRLSILLLALSLFALLMWHTIVPNAFGNFIQHPILWIFPAFTAAGIAGLFRIQSFKNDRTGFLFSTLYLVGGLTSSVLAMFPKLLPSTNNVNPALTIQNTSAGQYGLSVGVTWFVIGVILIITYLVFQHRIFSGKLDDIGYSDEH